MDPPSMMNGVPGAFPGPLNLSEIWSFPVSSGGQPGALLGLRTPLFGQSQFVHSSGTNQDAIGDDPVSMEPRTKHGGTRKRHDVEDESAKGGVTTSNGDGSNDCDGKRLKTSGEDHNRDSTATAEAEPSSAKQTEPNKPPTEPSKQDYIHVRARRGQATDSHSLAERARREKISERMKILQDLVPGCNKVIGKALVLDEIINYIQSLQSQVEFLSMKLEAVNARLTPGIGVFPPKDFGLQTTFDASGMGFAPQAPRGEYTRSSSPEWLHMQVGGWFNERRT